MKTLSIFEFSILMAFAVSFGIGAGVAFWVEKSLGF
jgi:hypothetical protein